MNELKSTLWIVLASCGSSTTTAPSATNSESPVPSVTDSKKEWADKIIEIAKNRDGEGRRSYCLQGVTNRKTESLKNLKPIL